VVFIISDDFEPFIQQLSAVEIWFWVIDAIIDAWGIRSKKLICTSNTMALKISIDDQWLSITYIFVSKHSSKISQRVLLREKRNGHWNTASNTRFEINRAVEASSTLQRGTRERRAGSLAPLASLAVARRRLVPLVHGFRDPRAKTTCNNFGRPFPCGRSARRTRWARPFSLSLSFSFSFRRTARPGALSEESDCNERGEFHPVAHSDAGSDRPAGIIVPLA